MLLHISCAHFSEANGGCLVTERVSPSLSGASKRKSRPVKRIITEDEVIPEEEVVEEEEEEVSLLKTNCFPIGF